MGHLRRYFASSHVDIPPDNNYLLKFHIRYMIAYSLIKRQKNTLLVFRQMPDYDVIVAGGSVSGLLAAREIAAGGLSVTILEEDTEIGTPEHCGGLVSMAGVKNLGIVPDIKAIENSSITHARILSRSSRFEMSATKQKVIVLDRRVFDKQIAYQAQKQGAEIRVKCSMRSLGKQDNERSEERRVGKECRSRWSPYH